MIFDMFTTTPLKGSECQGAGVYTAPPQKRPIASQESEPGSPATSGHRGDACEHRRVRGVGLAPELLADGPLVPLQGGVQAPDDRQPWPGSVGVDLC